MPYGQSPRRTVHTTVLWVSSTTRVRQTLYLAGEKSHGVDVVSPETRKFSNSSKMRYKPRNFALKILKWARKCNNVHNLSPKIVFLSRCQNSFNVFTGRNKNTFFYEIDPGFYLLSSTHSNIQMFIGSSYLKYYIVFSF